MEEPFSFSPVDKIPAKPGNYKARPLEKWNWLDFYNYFDDSHAQMVGKAPWLSMKEKGLMLWPSGSTNSKSGKLPPKNWRQGLQ